MLATGSLSKCDRKSGMREVGPFMSLSPSHVVESNRTHDVTTFALTLLSITKKRSSVVDAIDHDLKTRISKIDATTAHFHVRHKPFIPPDFDFISLCHSLGHAYGATIIGKFMSRCV